MKNRGTIYQLIWLDLGETNPGRYQFFTCPSAIYERFTSEEIGMSKGGLLNAMKKLSNDDDVVIFTPPKNPRLRIVKAYVFGKERKNEKNDD